MNEVKATTTVLQINETKLKRAAICLYVLFGIRMLASLYTLVAFGGLTSFFNTDGSALSTFNLGVSSAFIASILFNIGLGVLTVYTVQALKEQKMWAWLSGLTLCSLGLVSWGFPAALLGALSLLDTEVRGPYLNQLDIKL